MSPTLQIRELHSGYRHVPVLFDVSVDVAPGEIIGVLGANGAGKSTLLRTVAGVLPASSGSIRLGDRDLTNRKPWIRVRAGLSHVPEGRHVFSPMSVDDNLRVAGLAALRRSSELRDEVFDFFPRLAERRQQVAGGMSGGEQQMLAIARALMCDPAVLLVDELSAGLAPITAQLLLETLVKVAASGRSVILVEQSPHLVADIVDRVYLLERGRVAMSGSISDLGGASQIAERYLGVVASASAVEPDSSG